MILHCVFCRFRAGVPAGERQGVLRDLADFANTLDGVLAVDVGPNRDFEGKSPGYSDGFVIRFSDREALARYAEHPAHKTLGARLCGLCEDGVAGIAVFDIEPS